MSLANIYAPVIPSERRLFFNSFRGSLHTNEVRLFFSDGTAFPCRLQPSKCRPDGHVDATRSDCDVDAVRKRRFLAAVSKHVCGWIRDPTKQPCCLLFFPVAFAGREGALFPPARRRRNKNAPSMLDCPPDTILAHVLWSIDAAVYAHGHASNRWGMYLYSLLMRALFSEEVFELISSFTQKSAEKLVRPVAVECPEPVKTCAHVVVTHLHDAHDVTAETQK